MLPPGPAIPPALTTWHWLRRPLPFLEECRRAYGETFTIRIAGLMPFVVFTQPDAIKELFADDGERLHAGALNRTISAFLGDSSVLMIDGKPHLRKRRLLMPPFHGERMQKYGAAMIRETRAEIDAWTLGRAFPIHSSLQRITLRVILETIFGLAAGPKRDELEEILAGLLAIASWPPLLLPFVQRDLGAWSPWGKFVRLRRRAHDFLEREITERRRAAEPRDDILSLLLSARDEAGQPMSDAELEDELTTLLVAGHETTATALAWALRWILASPDVLRRLRAELEGAGPDKIAKLEYLDAVIRESMRLTPVIPLVGRVLVRPMTLGGRDLPAGVAAVGSIYLAHRREATYPRAWLFDPDRFLREKVAPHAFFPFGGGIRRCIGMAFALYEMKMVLATLLQRCDLELAPGPPITAVRRSITLAPSSGLPVIARDRLA